MISSGMLASHPAHSGLAKELMSRRDALRGDIAHQIARWVDEDRVIPLARHFAAVLQEFLFRRTTVHRARIYWRWLRIWWLTSSRRPV